MLVMLVMVWRWGSGHRGGRPSGPGKSGEQAGDQGRVRLTQAKPQKFSASSVEEDEQLQRAMEALGMAPPRAPQHYPKVDNALDESIEARAAALKKQNGGSKGTNLKALTERRDRERHEEHRQQWIEYYQRMIDVLEDSYEVIKERHKERIEKLQNGIATEGEGGKHR
jgi:hypothetical protein